MKTSEQIGELATALAAAQAIMKPAIKSKMNPHFKNKYADLDDIWDACREPLTTNGLSVVQTPSSADGRVIITTRLCHKSGQWIEDSLSLKPMKDDAQAAGSCITYGRRQMMGIIGITSDEDEDGHKASMPTNVKLEPKIFDKNNSEKVRKALADLGYSDEDIDVRIGWLHGKDLNIEWPKILVQASKEKHEHR